MKRIISLFVSCAMALALLAAPALSEGMEKTLGGVTFAVRDIYYDGRVAMLAVRQTAPLPGAVMVDKVFGDSANDIPEGAEEPLRVIPTYCDISFSYEKNGERVGNVGMGGGGMSRGNPLDSYGLMASMPPEVSPDSVEAVVTVAILTPELDAHEEMDRLIIAIPRTDDPLVDAAPDLNIGPTTVKRVVVSRTPLLLVVQVYHEPSEGNGYRAFSVSPYGDAALDRISSDTGDLEEEGLAYTITTFPLDRGGLLPEALRLRYGGGAAKELKVDLTMGTVEATE